MGAEAKVHPTLDQGSPESWQNDRSNFTAAAQNEVPRDNPIGDDLHQGEQQQQQEEKLDSPPPQPPHGVGEMEELQNKKKGKKGKAKKLDFHKIYNERRQILVDNDAENLVVMLPTLIATIIISSLVASIIGNQSKPIVSYLVEKEDSAGRITTVSDKKEANKNGLILLASIMGFLILTTIVLCVLFKLKCHLPITIYLVAALLFAGSFVPLLILYKVLFAFNWPFDVITIIILCVNFGTCIVASMMTKSSRFFDVSSKIGLSVLSAINLVGIFDANIVYGLISLMIVWDILAVLCPHGPLIQIIEATADDKKAQKQLGALVMKDKAKDAKGMLGLGDYVFYSIIVIVPVFYDLNYPIAILNCGATLSGFLLTMVLVYILRRPLPALPIPMFITLLFRFGNYYLTNPAVLNFALRNYY